MKKIALLILLAALAGLLYWHFTRPQPVAVTLGQAIKGDIESTVVNTRAGTIKACRRALLAPAIGGQIERLLVREGTRVKAGDPLLTLWSKDLEAEAALHRSEVVAASAQAKSTCLQADIAQRQAERYQKLRRDKVVSEDEQDRVISEAGVRQAGCESARTDVSVREGQVRATEAQLERTILIAPFAGIVADVNGEVGEFVTPSPPGIPTLPAVDLVDDGCFYVSAPIDEVDAAAIRVGMTARITLDAFGNRAFAGRVRRIGDYVLDREKQARTVDIEVAFSEGQELPRLLAGYSADAEVIVKTKREIVRIPIEALSPEGKVFVLHGPEGRLEARAVTTGLANFEQAEITSGLVPGERVVLSPDRQGVADGALAAEEAPAKP